MLLKQTKTLVKDYALSLTCHADRIVASLCNSIELLNLDLTTIWANNVQAVVSDSCLRENTLWTCDMYGVTLWDVRMANSVHNLKLAHVPLTLDLNASTTLLSVGTELLQDDANIHFWDTRHMSDLPLATFSDCHSDDITQIKFHPTVDNAMLSGSTDGLVCLYELKAMVEDDDLYQVIKDQSVQKLGYFGPSGEYVYVTSHIETLSLHYFTQGNKMFDFGDLRAQRPEGTINNVLDCVFEHASGRLFVVTGSSTGSIGLFDVQMGDLECLYTLNNGHSDIITSAAWDPVSNYLVSSSEDSTICLWSA